MMIRADTHRSQYFAGEAQLSGRFCVNVLFHDVLWNDGNFIVSMAIAPRATLAGLRYETAIYFCWLRYKYQ